MSFSAGAVESSSTMSCSTSVPWTPYASRRPQRVRSRPDRMAWSFSHSVLTSPETANRWWIPGLINREPHPPRLVPLRDEKQQSRRRLTPLGPPGVKGPGVR